MTAVLFDMDGTLLDTVKDLGDAMNYALEKEGFPTHPLDAYRYFLGDGIDFLVRRSMPKDLVEDEVVRKRLAKLHCEAYEKNWHSETKPYEGIPELLKELAKRKIPMAILSNKLDEFVGRVTKHYFPDIHFSDVRGLRSNWLRKPDPAAALDIAKQLNIPTSQWLYLGDTDTDMKTAVGAGMQPIGVLWGFRPMAELVDAGASILLASPKDLLDFIAV